jgi:2-phosphosulfolactate phosphatase
VIAGYAAGERGAREAARGGAAVVVVDAYRASTTIAVLVAKGARVVPVASIEEAERYPADFRIGERGSAKVKGFDFGNSPTEVEVAPIPPGSNVVLSSTNGTRIVEAAHGAPAIYTGAFVNARAVADGLLATGEYYRVAVVGCGPVLRGRVRVRRDTGAPTRGRRRVRRTCPARRCGVPQAFGQRPPQELRGPQAQAPRLRGRSGLLPRGQHSARRAPSHRRGLRAGLVVGDHATSTIKSGGMCM